MSDQKIRFEDGASYERMMGTWSRLVGMDFLDWLAPPSSLRWIDIGCGNGAFTELLVERCEPVEIHGIDPSEGQLAFARKRPAARIAEFHQGHAMELPFPDDSFDAAVMALVIFYVPHPPKGIAEMVRVVVPGGLVAAYIWDIANDRSPTGPIQIEMRAIGLTVPTPPSVDASRMESMRNLWAGAGLERVQTRKIVVERTFADFEDFWTTTLTMPNMGPSIAALPLIEAQRLKSAVQHRLAADGDGRITYRAWANAIVGRVPG
jgi:ubiquinone/menaquinone biosynthesis C-methylase UbiE